MCSENKDDSGVIVLSSGDRCKTGVDKDENGVLCGQGCSGARFVDRCNGQQLVVPAVESYVMVQKPPQAVIVINGAANLTRLVYEFERGLRIFHDVHIFATSQATDESIEEEDYDDYADDDDDKASQHARKVNLAKSQRERPCFFFFCGIFLMDFCFNHVKNVEYSLMNAHSSVLSRNCNSVFSLRLCTGQDLLQFALQ